MTSAPPSVGPRPALPREADAVVVGAGHHGLVASTLLADAGWDVVLLEGAQAPGGAVRSAEVTVPGHVHDLFSAFYPLGFASPVLRRLRLDRHGLAWSKAPHAVAHPLDGRRCAVLSTDAAAMRANLDAFAPGDGEAWARQVELFTRIRDPLVRALMRPFPPVRHGADLLRRLGPSDALRLARTAVVPVRRFGQEEFGGEGARVLLAGNALHTDLTPDSAASALYGWLLCMLGSSVGFPVPVGGAQSLTDALVSRARQAGVRLFTGRPVDKVLVAGGRATGVVTGSDEVRARRAVLADVAAPDLFSRLVGTAHLPGRMVDDLRRFEWDDATVKVDWSLSARVPWRTPEARRAGTVHVGADVDGLVRYAGHLANGDVPPDPFLLVGQMAVADPTRCPPGHDVVWAYTHLPSGPAEDPAVVDAHVARMEDVLEEHAPGFRDRVLGRHVLAPTTINAMDANLVAGAVNGGTASVHQQLVFRPLPGTGRPETPVRGLFLASAGAHPGGGVHGACGANAAHSALLYAGGPWGRARSRAAYAALDALQR